MHSGNEVSTYNNQLHWQMTIMGHRDTETDRQTQRQTDRHRDRQTDRKTNGQIDRQTETTPVTLLSHKFK